MAEKTTVLLVGWNPDVVDYGKWPGLTAEKLRAGLESDRVKFEALGYDVELGFIDKGETAALAFRSLLTAKRRDCVLIGAGVRTTPDYLQFFETLVNAFHEFVSAKLRVRPILYSIKYRPDPIVPALTPSSLRAAARFHAYSPLRFGCQPKQTTSSGRGAHRAGGERTSAR